MKKKTDEDGNRQHRLFFGDSAPLRAHFRSIVLTNVLSLLPSLNTNE
ncbi:MAG: hypothetical protein JNN25_05830 [Candidatus Kapabacteria bacterium]|nr:hypothetical protein [Candidatus Kapabacteria bacterium]